LLSDFLQVTSLGNSVVVPQIWGCERASARSHPQIWDFLQ